VAKLTSKHSHFENRRKIYFSVDFLFFLYYINTLNGAGKLIFRCCPGRKRLFARGSNKEGFGCQKKRPGEVEKGSENGRKWVSKRQKMGGKAAENESANKKKVFQVLPKGLPNGLFHK
jgi:hypothetical protein